VFLLIVEDMVCDYDVEGLSGYWSYNGSWVL
jgi:hypothetical protein